jgi:hypothetical protein
VVCADRARGGLAAPRAARVRIFAREGNVAQVSIVANWPTYRCIDFGFHYPACAWLQISLKGQWFVVAELAPHDVTTDEFAEAILKREKGFGLVETPRATYVDPAGNAVNSHTSETEVKILRRHGITCRSKPSGVREGCVLLMNALADPQLPLLVAGSCHATIEALASVPPDPHQPERYDERSQHTHILDALRYFAVNGPRIGRKPSSGGGVAYEPATRRLEF